MTKLDLLQGFKGFPGGSVGKELPAMQGFDPWVWKISWKREW